MIRPSLAGFYYYYMRHCDSKQKKLFKFALGRLSRMFPDANPRIVLAEHLLGWIYEYEKDMAHLLHERRLRDEPWTLEGDKATYMAEENDRIKHDLEELWDTPEADNIVDGTEIKF